MNSALPDNRPQEAKDKDYRTTELVTAAVAAFYNAKPDKLGAPLYDQWYVGSCVPHGFYTMLQYEGIAPISTNPSQLRVYRKRANYPAAGSIGVDILDKIRAGQSFDFMTPVGFTENQATAMPLIEGTKLIKEFKYFQHLDADGNQDFTLVAPDVAAGKAIAIFIYATEDEWSQEYVEIKDPTLTPSGAYVRHCICIMPKGDFTENGKQWLAVHDSANFGNRHLRYISHDFLLKRAYFSVKAYAVDALPPAPNPQPVMNPVNPVRFNDKNDDVKALQTFLVKEGKLGGEYVTGLYGALTARAVLWWQLEHWQKYTGGVPQLLEYAGKFWGKESIAIIQNN